MNTIWNHIRWGLLLFPFFISMFCMHYFPGWCLFGVYVLLIGAALLYACFSRKLAATIEKRSKRIRMRISTFIVGVGMIAFFLFVWASSYLDIGNYVTHHYRTVQGFPSQVEHLSSRSLYQDIKIGRITLKSVYEIPEEDFGNEIKAVYLPRSKYVLKLWIYR